MRKLIVSNLVSLDGFFEGVDNDLSWFKIDQEFHKQMGVIFDRCDTILIGRKTYELFVSFWPDKTREMDPAADFMNHSVKIVFSNTLKEAPWNGWDDAVLLSGNLEDHVRRIKQQPGKDIVIFGSGTLISALSQADLIDEYRFIVNNIILGSGHRMFGNISLKQRLKLSATTAMSFGVVILDYERERG
jgi:dihydrofolate reductase